MFSYAIRRLLGAIPTLFIIVTLSFFMMRIAPGGPFDNQRRLPPEIEHNIEAAYDLDKPVYQQYFIYLGKLLHGDFGPSYKTKDFTVTELIADGLPVTARIGGIAIVLAIFIGMLLGTIAALYQNRITDYAVMSGAMVGITIPTFVTAPILTLIFGVYGVSLFGLDLSLPVAAGAAGAVRNMILPVVVLALPQIAYIARLTRGQHGRGAAFQLRPHRPRQGAVELHDRHPPRAARRRAAAGLLSGTGHRRHPDGLADRRADLRHPRHRPLFRAGRAQPRLHAGDGRPDLLRRGGDPAEPAGRHRLRHARSPREIRAMSIPFTPDRIEEVMERTLDIEGRSLWDDAFRRLIRNRAAVVSIVILGLIALAAIFGPFLLAYDYSYQNYEIVACAPDWWPDSVVLCNAGGTHWFGTDSLGRDLLARTLIGARVSLAVGLIATLVSLVIGVAYGATAGYIGGRVDELMMRFVDVLYSIPYIFLVIILMVIFNRNSTSCSSPSARSNG